MHVIVMINETTEQVEDVEFTLSHLNAIHKAVAYITANHGKTNTHERFAYIFRDNSKWKITKYYIDCDCELHVVEQFGRIPWLDNIREIIEQAMASKCAYDSYEDATFPVKYTPDTAEEEENNSD